MTACRLPSSPTAWRTDLMRVVERRLAHEAVAPDGVEQLLLAHHRAAVGHEVGEHVEDLRLDLDVLAPTPQDEPGQVQLAVGKPDHRCRR